MFVLAQVFGFFKIGPGKSKGYSPWFSAKNYCRPKTTVGKKRLLVCVCVCVCVCVRTVEVWKHDFRGHYGLAQVYELLRMPKFALYYYKQAHRLKWVQSIAAANTLTHCCLFRSSDPRILLALGSCYYELNQLEEAKKVGQKVYRWKGHLKRSRMVQFQLCGTFQ